MRLLHNIKNNFFLLLYSALFSGMLIFSKHFVLRTDSAFDAHIKDVTIFDLHWFDLAAWLAFTVLISSVLTVAVSVLNKGLSCPAPGPDHSNTDDRPRSDAAAGTSRHKTTAGIMFFLAVFAFLIISWLPYTLTFMPFGVFSDTDSVIRQATGEKVLTNHHPVLYTFMWRAVYKIGNLLRPGDFYLKLFSILQELAAAAVYAYCIFRLRALNAGRRLIVLSALFTGLSLRFMPEDFTSGLPGVLIFMLYGILMMSIIIMTCVLSVTRFYKNLLGVEGYLMFSLPTDTGSLIASKVISVVIWSALSTITGVLAFALTVLGAGGIEPFRDVWDFFTRPEFIQNFGTGLTATFLFLVMMILGAAASITRIYAGIAIGHQFGEHPILMSVVALIGFNVIGTTLSSICSSIGIYSGFFDSVQQIFESDTIRALYLAQGGTILFMAVQIAFFGAITWILLDRRLNLA